MENPIESLHKEAMALADLADEARRNKEKIKAKPLYEKAFCLEKEAAILALNSGNSAFPVLAESASALGINAEYYLQTIEFIGYIASKVPLTENLQKTLKQGWEGHDQEKLRLWLKNVCRQIGSQAEVARLTKMHVQQISKLCRGVHKITPRTAKLIQLSIRDSTS
jgi:uncharacterized protein YecA (UPF0149 family)